MPNQFRRKTGQSAVTDRGYIIYCGRRPRRRSIRCSIRLALATRSAWLLLALKYALRLTTGLAWLALPLAGAVANNLSVTNTRVIAGMLGTAKLQFDIAWENSWRFTNINQDAAWVFFKVQVEGAEDLGWRHVTLSGTGTNPAGYATGTGTGVELVVPGDRKGLFLQRSAANEGSGSIAVSNVTAVWSLTDSGISPSSRVRMQTLAIEMVSVPQGAFWAGNTNGVIANSFRAQSSANTPCYISSEDAITIYWGTSPSLAVLTADFPKGFRAFYCMKYEISQGQYADFLNRLLTNQATTRAYTGGGSRHTITWNAVTGYTATARDRACNFLNWADGAAYVDWAALRPMTELEFEKACRGPMNAVDGEYPWGTGVIAQQTGHDTTDGPDGSGRERASPAGANCNYGNVMNGPVRVGIYATTNSTRQGAGASYWGIMELSGNLYERPVTVGHATGLLFTGAHGDGALDADGYANVSGWPSTDGTGAGFRGGGWTDVSGLERVADRSRVTQVDYSNRYNDRGWRGVRSAP